MPTPTEHKTVQARILEYAEAILLRYSFEGQVGWTLVSQKEAEKRRGIGDSKLEIGKGSLFFEDLLDANPSPPIGYSAARVRELILKRERRLRGFPDTAFRPRIPSPQRFIARPKPLSNPKFP